MAPIHKRFIDEQAKELIEKYLRKKPAGIIFKRF